jgi:hypothetical protein
MACLNALSAANAYLGGLDKITGVAKLDVYIATEGGFRDHPKVADGASELLVRVFGAEMLSSRIVLGVASLPLVPSGGAGQRPRPQAHELRVFLRLQ